MTDAGFFRGTSMEQDSRFYNKDKKLLKSMKFPPNIGTKVDMTKVSLDTIKPWISQRITKILGIEDGVVVDFIFNMLEHARHPDPKELQMNLTGFLHAKYARIFMQELWDLLLSAQENIGGIPTPFLEQKKEEIRLKKASKETHKDSLRIKTLEGRLSQLTSHSKATDKSLAEASSKLATSQRTAKELGTKLEQVQLARSNAEADLAIEKQWRVTLQMEIQREKNCVVELTNETKKFNALKKDIAALQERYSAPQKTVSEQEIAMVEMGRQLSLSQQKVVDMKQVSSIMNESVWVEDKGIVDCKGCNKPSGESITVAAVGACSVMSVQKTPCS